jgi:ferric-dicitrate binding protein FerR (iron transport regulator)
MTIHRIWNLIARKLTGEASVEELQELDRHTEEDSKLQFDIDIIQALWESRPDEAEEKDYLEATYILHLDRMQKLGIEPHNPDESESIISEPGKTALRKRIWLFSGMAGILALTLGLWFFLQRDRPSPTDALANTTIPEQFELTTRKGVKSKFMLPDGSQVWLNAGSKLTYGRHFGKENREVVLTGEGFFDVQKNIEKPFIITTSSVQIKVLGTAFNVKAYPEDGNTETSLIRGSIELTIKNRPNDKIILSPNEKIIVENSASAPFEKTRSDAKKPVALTANTLISIKKLKINPLDSSVLETQWVENKLVFRDESFREIALRMERWYDVQIDIQDPSLEDERLSGIFTSETVTEALDALKESMSTPFRFNQADRKIKIYR